MLEHRFTSKFVIDDNGCWVWRALTDRRGYGLYHRSRTGLVGSRRVQAHRYAYEGLVGPIPEGFHIDHLCRNPPCVNPAHLEPVTPKENWRRGRGLGGALWDGTLPPNHVTVVSAAKTHCRHGHEYTPENTYYDPAGSTHRRCRTCSRIKARPIGPPKPKPTHCIHGHELTPENTLPGYRRCRACMNAAQRAYQARKKGLPQVGAYE